MVQDCDDTFWSDDDDDMMDNMKKRSWDDDDDYLMDYMRSLGRHKRSLNDAYYDSDDDMMDDMRKKPEFGFLHRRLGKRSDLGFLNQRMGKRVLQRFGKRVLQRFGKRNMIPCYGEIPRQVRLLNEEQNDDDSVEYGKRDVKGSNVGFYRLIKRSPYRLIKKAFIPMAYLRNRQFGPLVATKNKRPFDSRLWDKYFRGLNQGLPYN